MALAPHGTEPGASRANGPAALAGMLLVVVALLIAIAVTQLGAPPFDRWLTLHLDTWRSGLGGAVFRTASRIGYATWLIPVALVAMVLIGGLRRSWQPVLLLALANPLTSLANSAAKGWFERPRPTYHQYQHVGGFSMPSGHASSSAAFAVAIVLALPPGGGRRVAGVLLVLGAGVVGASRVVLGVHYATDVLAGWAEGAGIALLIASMTTLRTRLPRSVESMR